MRCAPEETVTTRSVMRPSSRLVSAKWPRWLVPICSSKPSFVRVSGVAITPAVLTRTSRSPARPSAKARTEPRSERSSGLTSTAPLISAAAASPLAVSRTASVTRAPARASSRAAILPMPLLAPVTTTARPSSEGRSAAVHFEELMPGSLDAPSSAPMADVTFRAADGERRAYLARPAGEPPWPGVVAVHESFGLNEDMHALSDRMAQMGYLTLAGDFFGPGRRLQCVLSAFRQLRAGHGPFLEAMD